jgi:hypothetical protein
MVVVQEQQRLLVEVEQVVNIAALAQELVVLVVLEAQLHLVTTQAEQALLGL